MKQSEEDADGLLFVPGKHQCERQIVDTAVKCVRKSGSDFDRAVRVVALSHVHDPRESSDSTKIEVVKPVLSAGEGEDCSICRGLFYKFGIVAASSAGAVASAHEEDML